MDREVAMTICLNEVEGHILGCPLYSIVMYLFYFFRCCNSVNRYGNNLCSDQQNIYYRVLNDGFLKDLLIKKRVGWKVDFHVVLEELKPYIHRHPMV